jgi:hypothetical protein
VSEKPILFTGPMINAIIAGNKTLTSRENCNFRAGDVLWVRENFSGERRETNIYDVATIPPSKWPLSTGIWYWSDGNPAKSDWTKTKPKIFMCRWMSRITLEVTEVFKYNLQDLTDEMATSEGVVHDRKHQVHYIKGLEDITSSREPRVAYMLLLMHMKIINSFNDAPDLFGVRFKVLEIKK